MNLKW